MRPAAKCIALTAVVACLLLPFSAFADSTDKPAEATAPETTQPKAPEAPKPAAPTTGPFQLKIGDSTVRFGILLQPQADFSQTVNTTGGYAQSLQIRRARFLVGGNVTKNTFFFFETENSRLGAANSSGQKVLSAGFQTLDAVVEYRANKKFNLAGGLIRVPTSRDALESASSEFTIDFNTYAFTATGALTGTAGRDTGVMARGYFLKDRLEYRAGVFSGLREPGWKNTTRKVVRVQYNFFDTEVYNLPSYAGANFGAKKIVAVGAAYDTQSEFKGLTADLFADIPTPYGSALGTVTFQQLDGGDFVKSIGKSDILTADLGTYFKNVKIGPWVRYEQRSWDASPNRDEERILGGINYYFSGNNFNIKAGVGRYTPAVGKSMNQIVLQLQAFYY